MDHKKAQGMISQLLENNPEVVVRIETVPYHREIRENGEVVARNYGDRAIQGRPIRVSFVRKRGCLCVLLRNGSGKPVPVPCPSIATLTPVRVSP